MSNFVNESNSQRPTNPVYAEVIRDIAARDECPFCPGNLHKTHSNPILEDGEHWLATDNAFPYEGAAEHLLFIHKQHIESIEGITADAWQELKQLVEAMKKTRAIRGAALFMRFGDTALTGASVAHLHAQLVAGTGSPDAKPILGRLG